MTDRFPELDEPAASAARRHRHRRRARSLGRDGRPLPFAQLQRRIGRKTLTRKILDEVPVVLIAYDLLEQNGEDLDGRSPLEERRRRLAELLGATATAGRLGALSRRSRPTIVGRARRGARNARRELGVEGLMLKRLSIGYGVGPAQGRLVEMEDRALRRRCRPDLRPARAAASRASLFTDYTFGVWDGDRLVPFAKAYSGLTDAEIRKVDGFVRRNTVEKHGPVRVVEARAGVRAGVRGHPAVVTAQVGSRGPLPPDRALADGQAAGGGGYAG